MLREPKLQTPTVEDFYYDGDLDEQWAIDHYLGRDIDFTVNRYYTLDSLAMVHDFTLVGSKAFRYYIFGAFRFLQDPRSTGKHDVYAALPDIISQKIDEDLQAFVPIKGYLLKFCDWATENYPKFEIDDYVDIYGDVRARYRELASKVSEKVPS